MAEEKKKIEIADREENKDNKTRLPIEHYSAEFAERDPKDMAQRSCVAYDEANHRFEIHSIGRTIYVDWPTMEAVYADTGEDVHTSMRILCGRLILEGNIVASSGKFVPYQDIPWGEVYIKPFTGRCITRLAYMFKSADAFAKAAAELGGTPATEGDASADFEFVDGVIVRLIVWEADDEFPPAAQFLFSDNTRFAFSAEDLAALGDVLLGQLKAAGKKVL